MRENRAGKAKAIFLAVAEKGINGEQLQMTHNAHSPLLFLSYFYAIVARADRIARELDIAAWYRGGNLKSLIIAAICGNTSPVCLHSRVLHTRFVRFFTRVRLPNTKNTSITARPKVQALKMTQTQKRQHKRNAIGKDPCPLIPFKNWSVFPCFPRFFGLGSLLCQLHAFNPPEQ